MSRQDHQCGLRLLNVTEADAGIWRCEVMSSSLSPLDSVISLMRQVEEYRLGDWVAGARHEAQVELVIRNNEEIIFIDEEAEDTIIRNKEEENPEIMFIDEDADAGNTTIEANKVENFGRYPRETLIKSEYILVTSIIIISLVISMVGALKCRRCRHSMQKVMNFDTYLFKLIVYQLDFNQSWMTRRHGERRK